MRNDTFTGLTNDQRLVKIKSHVIFNTNKHFKDRSRDLLFCQFIRVIIDYLKQPLFNNSNTANKSNQTIDRNSTNRIELK